MGTFMVGNVCWWRDKGQALDHCITEKQLWTTYCVSQGDSIKNNLVLKIKRMLKNTFLTATECCVWWSIDHQKKFFFFF